jgi:hypothetical protein
MAKRSQRQSITSSAGGLAKRARNDEQATATSKRPKRNSSAATPKSTPVKSKYFEPEIDESNDGAESSTGQEESAYENENSIAEVSSSEEGQGSDLSEDVSEENVEPKAKGRGRSNQKATSSSIKNRASSKQELEKDGSTTGYGPGTQVIIKKPKARTAGSTPYSDETIHPNTFLFLNDLKSHNDRAWLKSMLSSLSLNIPWLSSWPILHQVKGSTYYVIILTKYSERSRLPSIIK